MLLQAAREEIADHDDDDDDDEHGSRSEVNGELDPEKAERRAMNEAKKSEEPGIGAMSICYWFQFPSNAF